MGWTDRRSKNGIVDGIAKNQNKIKGEEHMNDLIERLRLGDGTSADHELLLEAADALEALAQSDQEPVAYDKTEMNCFVQDLYDKKMQEGKHGHYETMFHVVHQAIKKVPPQRKPHY